MISHQYFINSCDLGRHALAIKSPIQVVIADRSARDGLLAILKTQPEIEVVGKTDQVAEVFVLVAATQPHVVYLDSHLAGHDIIETTRALKEAGGLTFPSMLLEVYGLRQAIWLFL